MNFVTFEFTDGSHVITTKHSDFPVQKLIFFLDKKLDRHFFLNKIMIENKDGKFFIGKKQLMKLVIEKQIIHRKEFQCQT